MSQQGQTPPEGTRAVIRAFQVFECLCASAKGKRISELSQETGLNKATIFRILSTLRAMDYAERTQDNECYRATMKILSISNGLLSSMELRTLAIPAIQKLVDCARQAVHLSMRDGDDTVIVEKMETDAYFRVVSHVGRRSRMYSTGTGKVLLAMLDEDDLNAYFERTQLLSVTPNTICNRLRLQEELLQIRSKGYGVDRQENALGISCIAAPIFNFAGDNVAAISVTGATQEIEPLEATLAGFVKEAAAAISKAMGHQRR